MVGFFFGFENLLVITFLRVLFCLDLKSNLITLLKLSFFVLITYVLVYDIYFHSKKN